MRVVVVALVALSCGITCASAQDTTIPQVLASANRDLSEDVRVQFGILPTLDSVIAESDILVRTSVGSPHTYLSDDERLIYSEYELLAPVVLSDPHDLFGGVASPEIIFKQVGGTISMFGYEYKLTQRNLPPLKPDTQYLFLLRQAADRFEASGVYFGVFEFSGDKILTTGCDRFAPELATLSAGEAVALIQSRMQ